MRAYMKRHLSEVAEQQSRDRNFLKSQKQTLTSEEETLPPGTYPGTFLTEVIRTFYVDGVMPSDLPPDCSFDEDDAVDATGSYQIDPLSDYRSDPMDLMEKHLIESFISASNQASPDPLPTPPIPNPPTSTEAD